MHFVKSLFLFVFSLSFFLSVSAQDAQSSYNQEVAQLDSILQQAKQVKTKPCSFFTEILERLMQIQTNKVATRADNRRKLTKVLADAEKRSVFNCQVNAPSCCAEKVELYRKFRTVNNI